MCIITTFRPALRLLTPVSFIFLRFWGWAGRASPLRFRAATIPTRLMPASCARAHLHTHRRDRDGFEPSSNAAKRQAGHLHGFAGRDVRDDSEGGCECGLAGVLDLRGLVVLDEPVVEQR